jgi:putative ABC transport system permease protein
MTPLQSLRVALLGLLRNPGRSLLTTLGIIIGVGAVIAMVAIGEGAKSRVAEAFAAMGTDLLIVQPGSSTAGGVRGGFGSQPTLTWDDLEAVQNEVPSVKRAAPVLRSSQSLVSDELNWTTSVYGTTPEYFDLRAWPCAGGQFFTDADVEGGAKVVVLGKTVVDKLFGPGADPVGATIRIGKSPYQVVGVAAPKGQSSTGQDYDDVAFMPYTTFASKVQGGLGKYLIGTIYVQSTEGATARAQGAVTQLLRARHNLTARDDDDFQIRNLSEIANAQQAGTDTLTTLLASVAAVSLLVGGIGIMNIMLVSVTERTREIGVRVALGATPADILTQFLLEALMLALVGGLLGLALGVGAATWLAWKFHWPVLVRPDVVVLSIVFSGFVGVGFGVYPAFKASRLDPIEALRYE